MVVLLQEFQQQDHRRVKVILAKMVNALKRTHGIRTDVNVQDHTLIATANQLRVSTNHAKTMAHAKI